jgi:dephospho-CoA kinase
MSRPFVIAVTGGAGAGKSMASRHFERLGATVIDSDLVGREVLDEPDTLGALVRAFGPAILDERGAVDRARLADAAFKGTQSLARLDSATHPRIAEIILGRLDDLAASGEGRVVVIEIPILESVPELAARSDEIVAIEAPTGARVARLIQRGIPEPDARRRIALQLEDAERRCLATVVVVNDADENTYKERLDRVWEYVTKARKASDATAQAEGGAAR